MNKAFTMVWHTALKNSRCRVGKGKLKLKGKKFKQWIFLALVRLKFWGGWGGGEVHPREGYVQ